MGNSLRLSDNKQRTTKLLFSYCLLSDRRSEMFFRTVGGRDRHTTNKVVKTSALVSKEFWTTAIFLLCVLHAFIPRRCHPRLLTPVQERPLLTVPSRMRSLGADGARPIQPRWRPAEDTLAEETSTRRCHPPRACPPRRVLLLGAACPSRALGVADRHRRSTLTTTQQALLLHNIGPPTTICLILPTSAPGALLSPALERELHGGGEHDSPPPVAPGAAVTVRIPDSLLDTVPDLACRNPVLEQPKPAITALPQH